MKIMSTTQRGQSLCAVGWQHVGSGIVVALMFLIIASAAMIREQSAASAAGIRSRDGQVFDHGLNDLKAGKNRSISHSVRLALSLQQLRDAEGRLTSNGESFFLLLARRMKSLSLNVMLTTNSIADAKFATTIAARMMREVSLESTQLRISMEGRMAGVHAQSDSLLTVTITRHETVDGDSE